MNANVRELCGVSAATANRILTKLTTDGRLMKNHKGGHWVYQKCYSKAAANFKS